MTEVKFRVVVGSYEHNLLCVSLDLGAETPHFTPIFHFQAHSLSVKCLDISKRYLVSGSNDEHIKIYDLQKRKELGTLLSHNGSITNLRFSKGGLGSDEGKGKWLLSASEDNKILVWRVKDWETFGTLKGHTARINDLDIHPSNRVAISVSEDHSIRLWNLMTAKKAAVLKLKRYNQNGKLVRWCGTDGNMFAVALPSKVLFYTTSTAKVHKEMDLGKRTVMHMEFEKISGIEYICLGLNDGRIEFWETSKFYSEEAQEDTPAADFSLLGHTSRIKDFRFYKCSGGHYLITIGSDGKIVVWDLEKREQVAVYDSGERLNCLAVCDESVEQYEMIRKRTAEAVDAGEQSEAEADPEELRKIMMGNQGKGKKRSKGKKKKKVEVVVEDN